MIKYINYLNLSDIFFQIDQTIYNKVLQALFTEKMISKLILDIGHFYVISHLLRTINSHYED